MRRSSVRAGLLIVRVNHDFAGGLRGGGWPTREVSWEWRSRKSL